MVARRALPSRAPSHFDHPYLNAYEVPLAGALQAHAARPSLREPVYNLLGFFQTGARHFCGLTEFIARKGRYASESELGNDMSQQSCQEMSLWVEDFHPLALFSASISLHGVDSVLGLFQTNAIETAVEFDGFHSIAQQ